MANKEIKFELAKVALTKCNFMTSETLTESLKSLYEWVVEEPEVEVETVDKSSLDSIDIKEVINTVRKNQGFNSGIATSLETIFNYKNDINTVGDLMRIGRRNFSKYRNVGKKSIWAIQDALDELGVTTW
jgi:DNA-directed RNA polymerase alpha subunit